MNRIYPFASAVLFAAFALNHAGANAQELHKWTDGSGKVHYGDRAAAPESSTTIKVTLPAPRHLPVEAAAPQKVPPLPGAQKKSVRVEAAQVGPQCKGLIDKIAAVPSGSNWESLYKQFDSTCPRIAYECVEYRSRPQNNQCSWVERTGSSVLNRKQYP